MCKFNSNNNDCSFEYSFKRWTTGSLYVLPKDEQGYCIFHSSDLEWKRKTKFSDYLKEYISGCLTDGHLDKVDLQNITFVANSSTPSIKLSGLRFTKPLIITNCIIADDIDTRNCIFEEYVDVYKTTFEKVFNCRNSQFKDRTQFNDCVFKKPAYFNDTIFDAKGRLSYLSFTGSIFNEQANFSDIQYLGAETDVNFQLVTFEHNVYFSGSKFERQAIFNGSTFNANADFRNITFDNTLQFNPRLQNDIVHIVKFTTADFSNAIFQRSVQFQEAIFDQEVNFEGIQVKPNSSILFRGNEQRKVFERPVNFNVHHDSIEGIITFEKTKVFWINKNQLPVLSQLEQEGHVYFINCQYAQNILTIDYILNGAPGSYTVFKKILEGLKEWVSIFTNNIQAYLVIDDTQSASNKIKIKVAYERDEDYILFQKLAKYFFECLKFDEYNTTLILNQISGVPFLNSFSTEENFYYTNLRDRLSNILKDVRRYWSYFLISSGKNLLNNNSIIINQLKDIHLQEEIFEEDDVESALRDIINVLNEKVQSLEQKVNELENLSNTKLSITTINMANYHIIQTGPGFINVGEMNDNEINNHSFNHLKGINGEELVGILQTLTAEIENSGNQEAKKNLEYLKQEMATQEPKKSSLLFFWNCILAALPHVKTISEIGENLVPLFDAIGK